MTLHDLATPINPPTLYVNEGATTITFVRPEKRDGIAMPVMIFRADYTDGQRSCECSVQWETLCDPDAFRRRLDGQFWLKLDDGPEIEDFAIACTEWLAALSGIPFDNSEPVSDQFTATSEPNAPQVYRRGLGVVLDRILPDEGAR